MWIRRRGFWRSYWFALRRSVKDKRARSMAVRISFVLAYLFLYVPVILLLPLRQPGSIWLIAFYGLIFGNGAIEFLMLRRSHRSQDKLLSYSLTTANRLDLPRSDDISPTVRNFLEERALILGSLLARAASEIYIRNNSLPPDVEVGTRQNLNALLRQNGLWDKLEPVEADLVGAADGSWTVEQQNEITKSCEPLRLLRWTLGIDVELMPLAHFPKVDFALWRDLFDRVSVPYAERLIRRSWDLRIERDIAREYTARVIAEFKGRGLIASDPELEGWADQLRDRSLGDSTDFLAGSKTIADLDDGDLALLAAIATTRERYAAYLVEQLGADTPISFTAWSKLS